jgi:hypothetical protein
MVIYCLGLYKIFKNAAEMHLSTTLRIVSSDNRSWWYPTNKTLTLECLGAKIKPACFEKQLVFQAS